MTAHEAFRDFPASQPFAGYLDTGKPLMSALPPTEPPRVLNDWNGPEQMKEIYAALIESGAMTKEEIEYCCSAVNAAEHAVFEALLRGAS